MSEEMPRGAGHAYPVAAARTGNAVGWAVAALVTSLVGVVTFCGPIGVAGAVLGHVARSRARTHTDPDTDPRGMARAAIVLGWSWAVITTVALVGYAAWLRTRP